jgi:hypothetical protein
MKQTAIALHVLIALALLSTTPAVAADGVTVQVTSISASMEKTPPAPVRGASEAKGITVDPKLAGFGKKLRSLFAYRRYSFLGKSHSASAFGEMSLFALPEHFALEVEPKRVEVADGEERIEMLVTLFRRSPPRPPGEAAALADREARRAVPEREVVLRTRIRLENGGTVLLGGPPIENGVLILALSARR